MKLLISMATKGLLAGCLLLSGAAGAADVDMKASHQWPGGKGDYPEQRRE